MVSTVSSETASLEDYSGVGSEFLLLLLLLDPTKESGSEDFYETNLFLGIRGTGLAEPVLGSVRQNNCTY